MVYITCVLLAVIAVELGLLLGRLLLRAGSADRDEVPRDGEPESGEFEKRWREGLDAMMGYDLRTARSAVRRDEDEEE